VVHSGLRLVVLKYYTLLEVVFGRLYKHSGRVAPLDVRRQNVSQGGKSKESKFTLFMMVLHSFGKHVAGL